MTDVAVLLLGLLLLGIGLAAGVLVTLVATRLIGRRGRHRLRELLRDDDDERP